MSNINGTTIPKSRLLPMQEANNTNSFWRLGSRLLSHSPAKQPSSEGLYPHAPPPPLPPPPPPPPPPLVHCCTIFHLRSGLWNIEQGGKAIYGVVDCKWGHRCKIWPNWVPFFLLQKLLWPNFLGDLKKNFTHNFHFLVRQFLLSAVAEAIHNPLYGVATTN